MTNNRDHNGIDTSAWVVNLPKDHPALTEDARRKLKEAVANANVIDTYPRPGNRARDDLELMYPVSVESSIHWDPGKLEINRQRFNNLSRAMKTQYMRNIRFYRKLDGDDKKSRK